MGGQGLQILRHRAHRRADRAGRLKQAGADIGPDTQRRRIDRDRPTRHGKPIALPGHGHRQVKTRAQPQALQAAWLAGAGAPAERKVNAGSRCLRIFKTP